jgi:hypothetical protein
VEIVSERRASGAPRVGWVWVVLPWRAGGGAVGAVEREGEGERGGGGREEEEEAADEAGRESAAVGRVSDRERVVTARAVAVPTVRRGLQAEQLLGHPRHGPSTPAAEINGGAGAERARCATDSRRRGGTVPRVCLGGGAVHKQQGVRNHEISLWPLAYLPAFLKRRSFLRAKTGGAARFQAHTLFKVFLLSKSGALSLGEIKLHPKITRTRATRMSGLSKPKSEHQAHLTHKNNTVQSLEVQYLRIHLVSHW